MPYHSTFLCSPFSKKPAAYPWAWCRTRWVFEVIRCCKTILYMPQGLLLRVDVSLYVPVMFAEVLESSLVQMMPPNPPQLLSCLSKVPSHPPVALPVVAPPMIDQFEFRP